MAWIGNTCKDAHLRGPKQFGPFICIHDRTLGCNPSHACNTLCYRADGPSRADQALYCVTPPNLRTVIISTYAIRTLAGVYHRAGRTMGTASPLPGHSIIRRLLAWGPHVFNIYHFIYIYIVKLWTKREYRDSRKWGTSIVSVPPQRGYCRP